MITRAQAEALLTLAESLEACERQGIEIPTTSEGLAILANNEAQADIENVSGMSVRLAVNALTPKQET